MTTNDTLRNDFEKYWETDGKQIVNIPIKDIAYISYLGGRLDSSKESYITSKRNLKGVIAFSAIYFLCVGLIIYFS